MKISIGIFILGQILLFFKADAQQSGNAVYGQNYNMAKGKIPSNEKLFLTDSTFIIEASVALNVIADGYVATFGLSEESPTLKESMEKMDKRIKSFTSDLNKLGVPASDIYVDMTAQNKIYDYTIDGEVAQEYLQGFELKKNVIIKFINISVLDNMMIAASNSQIYDLVKVDYIVNDLQVPYAQLFQSAMEIIQSKKELYSGATNAKLSPVSEIYDEQYYSYYPDQMYNSYMAYESGGVSGYDHQYMIKQIRKSETFYYDKINYSGFDKVINPYVTEPAVAFVLTLQVKFEIEK